MLKILRDKNTNFKRLKELQDLGLIELYDVILEENVPKKTGSKRVVPMEAILGETSVLPFKLPTQEEADRYEKARKIIGRGGIRHRDAMTWEAAIRHKMDYFVTNNKKDFINLQRRYKLEKLYPKLKIVTPEELEKILGFSSNTTNYA